MIERNKKPLIVALHGGPGSGKSTLAARVFTELKELKFNVELNTEFAKDLTWEESFGVLSNQIYVFAKQHHRIFRVASKVDIIVTDSPLVLSLIYAKDMSDSFKNLVMEEYNRFDRFDVFVERTYEYQTSGRNQTLDEAKRIDEEILSTYEKLGIKFDLFTPSCPAASQEIISKVSQKLL